MTTNLQNKIFKISQGKDDRSFKKLALEIFQFQAANNTVYKQYIRYLGLNVNKVKTLTDIPFLPVDFFKSHKVITGNKKTDRIFTSSGTTGIKKSKHYITDISIYEESFQKSFELFYGNIKNYCILALLPSYLEHKDSSLVSMMNYLIAKSRNADSGFYFYNIDELEKKLMKIDPPTPRLGRTKQKVLLFGVSYALYELAEKYKLELNNTIVMETGGMKGRRKEITREELHSFLTERLGVETIHSEYGMTELLSQAYSKGNGLFYTPRWMKILIRDTYDPFFYIETGKTGGINVIDLANINSCCFIETKDLGRTYNDGGFEVSGRFDNSDIRGCNLLY